MPATRPTFAVAKPFAAEAELYHAAALTTGRLGQTLNCVKTVLERTPNHPRALGILGYVAVAMEQPARGLLALQRAVALDPRFDHRLWLALCLEKLGCRDDALGVVAAAAKMMPGTANAHFAIGMILHALDRHQEAADFYAGCVVLEPTRAEAHYRRGRALQAAGRIELAVDAYNEAIRQCGVRANYHADLSSALSLLGCFEEACAAGRTAVDMDAGCVVGHNNLGHALHNLNRSAKALIAYETAIELSDTYPTAQFGYAVALLKAGDFARGWRQYEWRWQDCQTMRLDLGVPVWEGENIGGRTILLHAEQGLGDTLQFVRFAPMVASRGGRVVLEVPVSLVRLLREVDGVTEVIACGDTIPPIDLHCPMASLPLAFGLRLDTIPASPYLRIPARAGQRRGDAPGCQHARSIERPDVVVGLVWAGDPRRFHSASNLIDRRRSIGLDVLTPLFELDGVRFVSFQLGEARGQIGPSRLPITDVMVGVADFADTAVRLAEVDLLISVDTSMVHLAGGLGMPVWMMSRFDGCWRWLEGRDDTPWYPLMRIFRQPSPGDWSSVIGAIAVALRKLVVTGGTQREAGFRQL